MLEFPNIDPVAFSIGPFAVRWYALAYIAALLFAIWYAKRLVSTQALWAGRQPTATPSQIDDLFVWIALGVILGGRLGYVLFYNPLHFLTNPLDIFRMWEGGMSFHGGFLGVVVALYAFGKKHGMTLDRLLDLGAAATPVGLGLGRLANFINGELYGRAGSAPWTMIFPNDPLQVPRHPSQLYEAALEGLVLFLVIRIATHRYQALSHPGRASGLFALGYGLSRIIVEFFREPDAQLGYFCGFITMGMILSLPLVAIGIWLLVRSRRT
ncbi:prolipoprotein diacylglyceryl transferase [Nordella sp. HKS 07]|uniref:prolipoprotein diacylglyceryl transferase n=1 Tax=Nordella sp. HKS 07 TaxID=2712222 RepID=UPI0013E16B63|nr:prolipoprotein diacylglyceryl transferase [Nordella sp. HKS 07]QIG46476.1 prolipoprotein diacylglyceryl transferase [Nordella sp. HKS 07]